MADKGPWSLLSQRWLHIQLPRYRESPQHHTYEGNGAGGPAANPYELDEDCDWLMRKGSPHANEGLHRYERDIQPGHVERLAQDAYLKLPGSFVRFMRSPELQSRVRSRTRQLSGPWRTHRADNRCNSWQLGAFPFGFSVLCALVICTFFPVVMLGYWSQKICIVKRSKTRIG